MTTFKEYLIKNCLFINSNILLLINLKMINEIYHGKLSKFFGYDDIDFVIPVNILKFSNIENNIKHNFKKDIDYIYRNKILHINKKTFKYYCSGNSINVELYKDLYRVLGYYGNYITFLQQNHI